MEKSELQKQSLTILQQIEELKNWHKHQQLKLSTDNLQEKSGQVRNLENENNFQQTEKNIVTQQVFDEMPIQVALPGVKDVTENNFQNYDEKEKPQPNPTKPHRFLRKGEGIARFGMGPRKIPKPKSKNDRVLCLSSSTSNTKENADHGSSKAQKQILYNKQQLFSKDEIFPLEPPNVQLGLKNWKQILESGKAEEIIEKAIVDNQLELFQPDSSFDSSTASHLEKVLALAKNWKDKQELYAFETMEQHVLESSFSSSSSFVMRVMKDAIISTPTKTLIHDANKFNSNIHLNHLPTDTLKHEIQNPFVEENPKQLRPTPPIWTDPKSFKQSEFKTQAVTHKDLEESLHVRFAEEVDYKSFIENSQSLSSSNQKLNINEVNENEEWQEASVEDSICSSQCECSTTYSSSDEDVRAISPPGKPPVMLQTEFIGISKNSQAENLKLTDLKREKTVKENKMLSVDSSLEKKVKELEEEIEVFKTVNKKLESVRESLEKERKQLQQEKKKFLKEIEEEKKASETQLEEEKKKLAKEKSVFEKYSKTMNKNPTKEERKEIQALKEQLNEIKEELNKKESRWGAAQARVRNQVKLLEEDNKKLREEVEVLRKQAKYLEILTQKPKGKPFNNTKLIHAISEYLSNNPLDDQDCNENPVVGNYFSSKESSVKPVLVEVDTKNEGNIRVVKENKQENKPKKSTKSIERVYQQVMVEKRSAAVSQNLSKTEQTQSTEGSGGKSNKSDSVKKLNIPSNQRAQQMEQNKQLLPSNYDEKDSCSPTELVHEDGTIEKVFLDGRKEIQYKNGNVKKIDPLNGSEKTIYFNGDVKEIKQDGTSKYYFAESRIWQTTLPDGLELLDFPNGQVEKRHTNGLVETVYPNGCQKLKYPNCSEEVFYTDGTKLRIEADKTQILFLPNGQKEIHTNEYVRREYPDGTMKTVYPDGVTETVYSNGRVRLKDKDGNLVMDSATSANRL